MFEEILFVPQARQYSAKMSFFTTYSAPWWLVNEVRNTSVCKIWWSFW